MTDSSFTTMARSDFGRLRTRETLMRILSLLKSQRDEMLSLGDVRSLLRPETETYRGMQTIPIAKIVGSEGRYKDFNRAFLPRHDKLIRRWMSVDIAHYKDVHLPAIHVFEIGGSYFVRDGNHRVSVAKAQGTEFIDAEVISLSSRIPVTPGMTLAELKRAVIDFESSRFLEETRLDRLRPGCRIEFTEVGRYDELLGHIREHKWYINLRKSTEIPFEEAAASWYDSVYFPVIEIFRETRILARFPRQTEADLFVYVGRHWGELSQRYGPLFTLEEAAEDFVISRKGIAKAARRWAEDLGAFFRRLRGAARNAKQADRGKDQAAPPV
ncbi:MAG TPA: transcriptional regulator [Spirochaetia bacterium]|nr:transcriptional regulator [Spirochaetia bacterium]